MFVFIRPIKVHTVSLEVGISFLEIRSCFVVVVFVSEHGGYHKYPKVKPKVIIVKKIIPLSTTTFIG